MTVENESELRTLLPWYVNGTLTEADRARVEHWLEESESGRTEVAWLRRLRSDIQAQKAHGAIAPGTQRFARLLQADVGRPVRRWFDWQRWTVPALTVALSVVVVQGVVIANLMRHETSLETLSERPAAERGPRLQITFVPSATEAQIRAALQAAHVEIAKGPGALGVYEVAVRTGSVEDALASLRAQPVVVARVERVTP